MGEAEGSGRSRRASQTGWQRMRWLNTGIARLIASGRGPTQLVLLLTTTGRSSGLPRVAPLQYEEVDGVYYVASARGRQADWFRNIVAHPRVVVELGKRQFEAVAEPITDPQRIADFLELRLQRHPIMLRLMLWAEGMPLRAGRVQLEALAQDKALVALHPETAPVQVEAGQEQADCASDGRTGQI